MKKKRMDPNDEITIVPDWSGSDSIPPYASNVAMVQADPDFHVLTLGFLSPPRGAHMVEGPEIPVPVSIVARVLLTPRDVESLIDMLRANLDKRMEIQSRLEILEEDSSND